MRNFVAKNDFNRASTHKSLKDYVRAAKHELLDMAQDDLDQLMWEEECLYMEEDGGLNESDLSNPLRRALVMGTLITRSL